MSKILKNCSTLFKQTPNESDFSLPSNLNSTISNGEERELCGDKFFLQQVSLKNREESSASCSIVSVSKLPNNCKEMSSQISTPSTSLIATEPAFFRKRKKLKICGSRNKEINDDLLKMNVRLATRKSRKKKVNFGGLRVFYFNRAQGFDTVPMVGSVALGMEMKHDHCKDYSFFEFNKANRRENSEKCASWRSALQSHVLQKTTKKPSKYFEVAESAFETIVMPNSASSSISSSQETFTTAIDVLNPLCDDSDSTITPFCANLNIPKEAEADDDTVLPNLENYESNSSSSLESEEDVGDDFSLMECFLRPIDGKIRKTILKHAGISIDKSICEEYKHIINSRSTCGCSCADGKCLPETCECAHLGIMCQVDKPSFPCSCLEVECQNPEGRIEFDPVKVHSHYIQTIMRIKVIEKRGLEDSPLSQSPQHIKFDDNGTAKKDY